MYSTLELFWLCLYPLFYFQLADILWVNDTHDKDLKMSSVPNISIIIYLKTILSCPALVIYSYITNYLET